MHAHDDPAIVLDGRAGPDGSGGEGIAGGSVGRREGLVHGLSDQRMHYSTSNSVCTRPSPVRAQASPSRNLGWLLSVGPQAPTLLVGVHSVPFPSTLLGPPLTPTSAHSLTPSPSLLLRAVLPIPHPHAYLCTLPPLLSFSAQSPPSPYTHLCTNMGSPQNDRGPGS